MKLRISPLWLFLFLVPCAFVIWPRSRRSVVRINSADANIQAAAKQAVKELPKFIDGLKKNEPGYRFAIRAAFPTPEGPEYLWVKHVTQVGDNFQGDLDQVPVAATSLKKGDHVVVKKADVFDWMIGHGSETEGGYTEKALANR